MVSAAGVIKISDNNSQANVKNSVLSITPSLMKILLNGTVQNNKMSQQTDPQCNKCYFYQNINLDSLSHIFFPHMISLLGTKPAVLFWFLISTDFTKKKIKQRECNCMSYYFFFFLVFHVLILVCLVDSSENHL